jgi:serine/threonine protein kinase
MAPEIIKQVAHNKSVDFWALGIMIYEFLQGCTPF